jgi:hypothetical protein
VARYRYSGKALATALGTNVVEIRTPSTARARLRHLKVFSEAATALNLALFRTTVVGTAGTAVTATKTDPADAAPGSSVVTGPTGGTLEATARARVPASGRGRRGRSLLRGRRRAVLARVEQLRGPQRRRRGRSGDYLGVRDRGELAP